MEPLLPDAPLGVHLYTEEFYAVARRSLAPGGILCQWVPPHALEPPVFDTVLDAFARAWPWSGAWISASQVLLVGAEGPPALDPGRFAAAAAGPEPLAQELRELGLASPELAAARFIASGAALPRVARRLSDRDPWIAYRDKPSGAAVLAWLPANLRRLIELREPDADWLAPGAGAARAAYGELCSARAAVAEAERDLAAGTLAPGAARAAVDRAVARAARAGDPEAAELAAQAAFLWNLREGVAALQAGDARAALEGLVAAAERRGERADVHLYLAAALARLGLIEGAERARAAALERCPRVAETAAGRRVRALGFDPAAPAPAGDGPGPP
jgi:spermidine synthase